MFKNKEGKIRSGWKIAGLMLTFLIADGILYNVIIIVPYLLYIVSKIMTNQSIDNINLDVIQNNGPMIFYLSMFGQVFLEILISILAWKFIIKRSLSNMGLTPIKKNYKELLVGLLFGIVSMTVVFLLIVTTGNASVKSWSPHFAWDQILYFLLFIFVGFAEEIFTRGFIMSTLRQMRSAPAAILISAIIFALMHSSNDGIALLPYINLTLVGILFAYIYYKSGNIWMCIGFHITWNYFQGNVYGFKVSGIDATGIITTQYSVNNILNGGAFGPEGGLYVTIVILAGLLFVKYYYRNSEFDFIASEPAANINA